MLWSVQASFKCCSRGCAPRSTLRLVQSGGTTHGRHVIVPKLYDANLAGGTHSLECTLILTEGDSAKALAVAGLSVIGRDRYGVFPLRGKLLNVSEASPKQLVENEELQHLVKAVGLQYDKQYEAGSKDGLRYGRVLMMTDQDHDGACVDHLNRGKVQCSLQGRTLRAC